MVKGLSAVSIMLCLLAIGFTHAAFAQNLVWAKKMGGAGYETSSDVALDGAGSVYSTGAFDQVADFDPGSAVYNLSPRISGEYTAFVAKLNSSGGFVCAKPFIGSSWGYNITVDRNKFVYISGQFSGAVDFDPGPGVVSLQSAGGGDIFLVKLDPAGQLVWAKQFGNSGATQSDSAVTVDPNGNVYLTGSYSGLTDFDPGPGVFVLPGNGEQIFLAKLTSNGIFVWAKSFNGGANGTGRGVDLILDASGNIYTTGWFTGTVDFDPGPGSAKITERFGSGDVYIAKLRNNGALLWVKRVGGPSWDIPDGGIGLDRNGGVYVSGSFSYTVDFNPGSPTYYLSSDRSSIDVFVLKLSNDGVFGFARQFQGPQDEGLVGEMAVDQLGNTYLSGIFQGIVDFDPCPDTFYLSSNL